MASPKRSPDRGDARPGCPRCNPEATAATFAVVAAALFAWGVLSARLERADLTAPIVFSGVGLLISRVRSLAADVAAEIVNWSRSPDQRLR